MPCLVAAPSRIARAPSERVKTDRRDAIRLARLLRLAERTPVRVPAGAAEEAARDLVRARHRLSKLLLRQGLVSEGSAWTLSHQRRRAAVERLCGARAAHLLGGVLRSRPSPAPWCPSTPAGP